MWFETAVISPHPKEYLDSHLNSKYLQISAEVPVRTGTLRCCPHTCTLDRSLHFPSPELQRCFFPVTMELTWKFAPTQTACHSFFLLQQSSLQCFSCGCTAGLILYWEICSWFQCFPDRTSASTRNLISMSVCFQRCSASWTIRSVPL